MSNTQELVLPTSPADIEKLQGMIQEGALTLQKIDDQKLQLKAIYDAIKDELNIPPKYSRKLIKTFYKDSFRDEVSDNEDFIQLYELIDK